MSLAGAREDLEGVGMMLKQRVLSACVAMALFAGVLCFLQTAVFDLAVALLCALAAWELGRVVLGPGYGWLKGVCLAAAAWLPLGAAFGWGQGSGLVILGLTLLACGCSMRARAGLEVTRAGFVFAASFGVGVAFCCLTLIKGIFAEDRLRLLAILAVAAGVCGTDTGAYFVGIAFGKHKLTCSDISPKKTKEGVVGGVVACFCAELALCLIFKAIWPNLQVNWLLLCGAALVASGLSVFGDLFASLVKRQSKVKDFGKLIPGHGGVLDRLDSLIFVAPFFYFVFSNFKVFWL